MTDSLKSLLFAPFDAFAKGAESFARDSLGVDVIVADTDTLRATAVQHRRFAPRATRGEHDMVTITSLHTPERAEEARAALEENFIARGHAQLARIGPGMSEQPLDSLGNSMAAFARNYTQDILRYVNSDRHEHGEDAHEERGQVHGTYHSNSPSALRQTDFNLHVVTIDSSVSPQLQTAAQMQNNMQCTIPHTTDLQFESMQRLHTAYHELAHARNMSEHQALPLKGLSIDRNMPNYREMLADGFASAMLLRDFGREALPFLKHQIYGSKNYTDSGDVDHYTAPIMDAVLKAFDNNPAAFQKATPLELLRHVDEAAQEVALAPGEPALLQAHRKQVMQGQTPNPADLPPVLQTYEAFRINKVGALAEARAALNQQGDALERNKSPALQMADENYMMCRPVVNLAILKAATPSTEDTGPTTPAPATPRPNAP